MMRAALISLATILAGCASLNVPSEPSAAPKTALSPQILKAGECGLFVWTADSARRFILFSRSQNSTAVYFDGRYEQALNISAKNGSPSQGQFPQQNYDSGLSLSLKDAQSVVNGMRYRAGTLRYTDADGWARVRPVVGLSTCQPSES